MFRAYAPNFRSNRLYTTAAKGCSRVSVVEGTVWVAVVWKRVVAEGVTTVVEGTVWVAVVWRRVPAAL
jgi:hypothetical protein